MQTSIDNGFLVIRIPMGTPSPSSTGKTLIVASTHGNHATAVMVDGKPLVVSVNAYVKK